MTCILCKCPHVSPGRLAGTRPPTYSRVCVSGRTTQPPSNTHRLHRPLSNSIIAPRVPGCKRGTGGASLTSGTAAHETPPASNSRSPSYRALRRRRRSMLVRLSRSSLIAGAAQSVGTCDLVPKKRVVSLRTGCCSSPKSSGFRGRRMRSGISGYQTPSSGRRVTRVVREAA